MPLTPDILNEHFNNLDLWTDGDTDTAVSEIDPAEWLRLDTNAGAAGNALAYRYQDIISPPNQFTIQIKIFCDLIGVIGQNDFFTIKYGTATWKLNLTLGSDGCFIYKTGGGSTEIGTDIVKYNGTGAQIFRIEVDKSGGEAAAVCDVYLNNVLVGDNIDCDYEVAGTNGRIGIQLLGYTTDNMVSHIDYIKIATGLGEIAEDVISPDLLNESCDIIDAWTDGDVNSGVSWVYPAGIGAFFFQAEESVDQAIRYRTIASPPNRFTFEIDTEFTAMDVGVGYETSFYFFYSTATWRLKVLFSSLGLFVYKTGGASVEVGTNIVKFNVSAAWQSWRFQVDKTFDEASATVEVFLKEVGGAWVSYGVFDCDYEVAGTDGQVYLLGQGTVGESTIEFYLDNIKIGTGLGEFASFVPKIDIF